MDKRASGILMHISSLPSLFGVGDFGPTAYRFVDFLCDTRQKVWQILPLNPTGLDYHNSPYNSYASFGYNPLFISPKLLVEDGLLLQEEIIPIDWDMTGRVRFDKVYPYKYHLFELAFERLKNWSREFEFEQFKEKNELWLDDLALFVVLRNRFNDASWSDWPIEFRDRHPDALQSFSQDFDEMILKEKFLQFICDKQWKALRSYCHEKGVLILGDIPIYVTYESSDVWSNPHLFKLDKEKKPYVVSGVPPDYFSKTGQLWGNPIYNWEALKDEKFHWWIDRIQHNLNLFDWLRIDHFRGLVAYWEIPAQEETAIKGQWVDAPVYDLLNTLFHLIPGARIIVEDLGTITSDVLEVMRKYKLPGMKILQFAFGEDMEVYPYIPHRLSRHCLLYTGTHDNNTTRGWFEEDITHHDRERLFQYLGRTLKSEECSWVLIRLAMQSVADVTIFPMQDILNLGSDARMNTPSRHEHNWQWQMNSDWRDNEIIEQLKSRTKIYGRI